MEKRLEVDIQVIIHATEDLEKIFAALVVAVVLLAGCSQQPGYLAEQETQNPAPQGNTNTQNENPFPSPGDYTPPQEEPEEIPDEPAPAEPQEPPAQQPQVREYSIEADDRGFYPEDDLVVNAGDTVRINFTVRTAEESDTIVSYWPSSGVRKASMRLVVN